MREEKVGEARVNEGWVSERNCGLGCRGKQGKGSREKGGRITEEVSSDERK